jgi:hypothetical protein
MCAVSKLLPRTLTRQEKRHYENGTLGNNRFRAIDRLSRWS